MSIGNSGRIVIEVEPDVKRRLYSALARDGLSLKQWFLKNAEAYLEGGGQLLLPFPYHSEDDQAEQHAADNNKLPGA
jgi:hypothetical protein